MDGSRWANYPSPDKRVSLDMDGSRWSSVGSSTSPDIRISLDLDDSHWSSVGRTTSPDIRISLDLEDDLPKMKVRAIVASIIADMVVKNPETGKCILRK
jgi:hypothetical protein